MILKIKKNIFICFSFCIFLIQIYSNNIHEFKIDKGSIIFRGKEIDFNASYTKEDIEKKFGKTTYDELNPGGLYLGYEDDGLIMTLDHDGKFKGISMYFNFFHKIEIHGLTIEQGNTYSEIRKKIEKKKLDFIVIEGVNGDISIEKIIFFNKNTGNMELKIWFSNKGDRKVEGLFYGHKKTEERKKCF